MELLYSLTRDYLLYRMTLGEILRHWHHGYRYDMQRRGYTLKKHISEKERDELMKRYYSPAELAEIEAYKQRKRGK